MSFLEERNKRKYNQYRYLYKLLGLNFDIQGEAPKVIDDYLDIEFAK